MKPEHFKIKYNCCYCKHIDLNVEGVVGYCDKHHFVVTAAELMGVCDDFERDK